MEPGSPHEPAWRERFFGSTRGRILLLLRREPRTAGELSDALRITPNAVRGHLASLERDGLVGAMGVRRDGVGKPPRMFATTDAAEALFPKAYDAVLANLLDVLEDRVGADALRPLLRRVGRRAGREAADPAAAPLERAVGLLAELGAEVEVMDEAEGIWLRGHACPLGDLVTRRPELCELMSALLEEATGRRATDHCLREGTPRPRCAFLLQGETSPSWENGGA